MQEECSCSRTKSRFSGGKRRDRLHVAGQSLLLQYSDIVDTYSVCAIIVCVDIITTVIIYYNSTTESRVRRRRVNVRPVRKTIGHATYPTKSAPPPTLHAVCAVIGDPDLCVTDGRVPPVTSVVSLAAQTNTRVPSARLFVSRKLCKIHTVACKKIK